MQISELLNVKTPEIEVGDLVFVTNPDKIYSAYTEFAERVGFPTAAVDDVSINNPIQYKVYKGLTGVVLAKDRHSEKTDDTLCVVETEDKFQFIISINGLR